jgi:hypothetical protein
MISQQGVCEAIDTFVIVENEADEGRLRRSTAVISTQAMTS